jgi:hypothetical protein
MPERPTATLVITQGEEPDEISLDLKFEPEAKVEEQIMAYHAMLVGYAAIIQAIEPKEESSQP